MGLISRVSSRTYRRLTSPFTMFRPTKTLLKYAPNVPRGHPKQIGILPKSHENRPNPMMADARSFGFKDGKFIAKAGNAIAVSDNVTHTGQYFDENDLVNVKFTGKGQTKLVNPNWAIDLVNDIPPIAVHGKTAMCDGSLDPVTGQPTPGAMGHPKVYINLEKGKVETC